ncbi:hypothetical protein [Nitrosophilus kaiyonis]|uniref:hypothetical protein n=1 Tax=Nitrosophilus kaiyonis TaxID=2930200 RepID=UPI002491B179|nr:hypothetical protein [Nitrosophilus kaiyonis]
MPHHKHHEKLQALKEAIEANPKLSQEEKSNAIAHIEEWYEEDKAQGILWDEIKNKLLEISEKLGPILDELGFM